MQNICKFKYLLLSKFGFSKKIRHEARNILRRKINNLKGNKVIIVKDGFEKTADNLDDINGFNINFSFVGKNSTIKVHLPITLEDFSISVEDNTFVELGKNSIIRDTKIISWGGGKPFIKIGENCSFWKNVEIFVSSSPGFVMGNDCMVSYNITIWDGDGHQVTDKNTGEIINKQKEPLIIGDHCWISNNVYITKNAKIPNNTIVAMGAVVSKKFEEENTVIAGNPSKVVKKDVDWNRKNIYEE